MYIYVYAVFMYDVFFINETLLKYWRLAIEIYLSPFTILLNVFFN